MRPVKGAVCTKCFAVGVVTSGLSWWCSSKQDFFSHRVEPTNVTATGHCNEEGSCDDVVQWQCGQDTGPKAGG